MLKRLKAQQGFTFVEVLIALLVLSVFAITFLMGLAVSSHAVIVADKRITAESIARSQMERIKNIAYVVPVNGEASYPKIATTSGFTIWSKNYAGEIVEGTGVIAIAWNQYSGGQSASDTGLQKVTVIIKKGEDTVFTLEAFKRNENQ